MVKTIEQAVQDMRSKSKVPLEDVVNETGIAESTLYRKCSPTDPDIQFKINEIIPVMRGFRRFEPLEVIARACGFLLVKSPRGRLKPEMSLAEFHTEFSSLFTLLLDFMADPTAEKMMALDAACIKHMQSTANIREGARKNANQMGIEFADEDEP